MIYYIYFLQKKYKYRMKNCAIVPEYAILIRLCVDYCNMLFKCIPNYFPTDLPTTIPVVYPIYEFSNFERQNGMVPLNLF